MSLLDSIDDLITDTLTVSRHTIGTFVNGIYVPATPITFTIDAVVQPAFGLNRVVGGANLDAKVAGQEYTDVRVVHTRTLLKTLTATTDPDVIIGYENANWEVARVERWELTGEVYYHVIITKLAETAT